MAAKALARVGTGDARAVAACCARMEHEDKDVRKGAVEVIYKSKRFVMYGRCLQRLYYHT